MSGVAQPAICRGAVSNERKFELDDQMQQGVRGSARQEDG